MENDPFLYDSQSRPSRLARVGGRLAQFFRDAREQLATADLNPHEGRLRSSAAPAEYLPQVPDFPPIHDDTIPPSSTE